MPALASLGVGPLPQPTRRGPPSLVVAPRLTWWAASCGLRCPLSSAWPIPGRIGRGIQPRPGSLRPPNDFGGAHFVSGKKERMVAALPHVVRGEVKGRRRVRRACRQAWAFPAATTAAVLAATDGAAIASAATRSSFLEI